MKKTKITPTKKIQSKAKPSKSETRNKKEKVTRVSKNRCYVVIGKENNYVYGAFHFSTDGLKKARKYVSTLKSDSIGSKFIISQK